MDKKILLECLDAFQWNPKHLNKEDENLITTEQLIAEIEDLVENKEYKISLRLISLSQELSIQDSRLIELKAGIYHQLNGLNINNENDSLSLEYDQLYSQLQRICDKHSWDSRFITHAERPFSKEELTRSILQEANSAQQENQSALILDLVNASLEHQLDSLWMHHYKALALRDLGHIDASIDIWEKLSVQKEEKFSNIVHSCLHDAKQRSTVQQAKILETTESTGAALEHLAKSLLENPDREVIRDKMHELMLNQRHISDTDKEQKKHQYEHLIAASINEVFLTIAEKHLNSD